MIIMILVLLSLEAVDSELCLFPEGCSNHNKHDNNMHGNTMNNNINIDNNTIVCIYIYI